MLKKIQRKWFINKTNQPINRGKFQYREKILTTQRTVPCVSFFHILFSLLTSPIVNYSINGKKIKEKSCSTLTFAVRVIFYTINAAAKI